MFSASVITEWVTVTPWSNKWGMYDTQSHPHPCDRLTLDTHTIYSWRAKGYRMRTTWTVAPSEPNMEKEAIPRWGSWNTQSDTVSVRTEPRRPGGSSLAGRSHLHPSGHGRLIQQQLQHVEADHQDTHHLETHTAVTQQPQHHLGSVIIPFRAALNIT